MSVTIITLICLLAAHFVGDFAWQSAWMGMEKGRDWNALLAHCATYTSAFVLFNCLSTEFDIRTIGLVAIFITHVVIDLLKARYQVIKKIWQDQLLHFAVIAVLVVVGWIN